jgi:membrane-associated phospholipid phosphatase
MMKTVTLARQRADGLDGAKRAEAWGMNPRCFTLARETTSCLNTEEQRRTANQFLRKPNFHLMHTARLKFELGLAVTAWFLVVYVGCDQLTAGSNAPWSVRLTLDDAIPFLPHLAPVYLSIAFLVYLPLFVIDETSRLVALALSFAFEIAVAGTIFLAFPVAANTHPPGDHGRMFEFLDLANLTYNSLPSLHVALAVSAALALHGVISSFWRTMLWTWTFLVVASTLLTKQHLIADAIAGGMLGIFAILVVCPLVQRAIARCVGEKAS